MINSRKYTLIDLFKATDNEEESQYLPLNNIEVPIIQRDYAQGRNQPEVNRIRARFLDALYTANPQTYNSRLRVRRDKR